MSTNSTNCNAQLPVNNPFLVALDSSSPTSYVIASVEDDTYKPAFKLNTNGIRTLPYQPFFNAHLSTNQLGQTGAGRWARLVADAVVTNIGEHYNSTSGQFKAPIDGVYHFDANIVANRVNAQMTEGRMYIAIGSRQYQRDFKNPATSRVSQQNHASFSASWTGFMETNQTAETSLRIIGSTQNSMDLVAGSADLPVSGFSGYLLG